MDFITTRGRSLECTLWSNLFDGGPVEEVLEELGKYQNDDGGFGKALEPDLRALESSALCTTFALDLLVDLSMGPEEPLVDGAITYLLDTYDDSRHVWRIIPPTADTSPHAPWWNQEELDTAFQGFLANPRAKICGYLFHYQELTPSELRVDLLNRVLSHVESEPDKVFADTLKCYVSLYQCKNLPADARVRLKLRLDRMIPVSVESDSSRWGNYCLKPISVIKSAQSPFRDRISEALHENLDYESRTQCDDGSWPFWSWGDLYPRDWAAAEREWRGY